MVRSTCASSCTTCRRQDVISRDNVSVKVNAVIYFRIVDPERAIIQVENFMAATSQLAQTTLRSVLGKHELDEMLAERDKLNSDIQEILDQQTDAWGIKVANVEIKHVDLNESMVRAIARQAEAERAAAGQGDQRRGRAAGGGEAVEAGRMLAQRAAGDAAALFRALHDIASERASTIVFPVPMDLLGHFNKQPSKAEVSGRLAKAGGGACQSQGAARLLVPICISEFLEILPADRRSYVELLSPTALKLSCRAQDYFSHSGQDLS